MRFVLAAGVLVAAFSTVRFLDISSHDTSAPQPSIAASSPLVSTPLSLPGQPSRMSEASAEQKQETMPDGAAGSLDTKILPRLDAPTVVAAPPSGQLEQIDAKPAASLKVVASTPALEQPAPSLLETGTVAQPIQPTQEQAAVSELATVAETTDDLEVRSSSPRWVEHEVASGDSLARIFKAQNLEPALLHRIVNSGKDAKTLASIRPGQTLRFRFDELGELTQLQHHRSRIEHLDIAISEDAVTAEVVSQAVEKRTASAAGVIASSLFLDGQKAGLSDSKIMELAAIFGWDIDFALEIRAGDEFRMVYEEHLLDGEKLRDGPILAAEFTNRGKTYRALRYENEDGEVGYYDETGHSKRRAFLRTPIKFARISSRYNPKRWHPVLKKYRAHRGVDYAAPTGTPIKAAGDGKVIFRGTKGGYGRTVILQHAGKYTTLYAHMSKFSKRAKQGARVKQGQIIGYVGSTGVSTGPHLHYEFRVNGVHKNPLKVKLPKALPLPKKELPAFKTATTPLLAQLEAVSTETMVASVSNPDNN